MINIGKIGQDEPDDGLWDLKQQHMKEINKKPSTQLLVISFLYRIFSKPNQQRVGGRAVQGGGLKIHCDNSRVGSNPTLRTLNFYSLVFIILLLLLLSN